MYYGWVIVGVAFVTHFVSVGFIFYSYSVFLLPITEELGGNRLLASFGLAFMNIATGLTAPFVGRALDHLNTRNVMAIGTVALAIGFFLASRIDAFWQFYLLMVTLIGIGAGSIGALPSTTLVANWFVRKRGKALGISTMGVSLSGVVMVHVTSYLVHSIGWRETFIAYGLITLGMVLPLVLLLVVKRPEEIGLLPDGDEVRRPAPKVAPQEPVIPVAPGDQLIDHAPHFEWSTIGALRERNFWMIVIVVGLNFFAMSATLIHMIPRMIDLGFSAETHAPWVLAVSALIGVPGKLVFGWVTDHMDTRWAFLLAIAFQIAGVFLLLSATTYTALMIAGGLFGFGMGGVVPLYGSLVGEAFGRFSFGRIMGLMSPCMLPIQTTGIPFAGYVYDRTGGYELAYKVFLGTYVLSAALLFLIQYERNDQ